MDNVVSLVDAALARAILRFSYRSDELSPPIFGSGEQPLSDSVAFRVARPVVVLGVRIVVPGVFEVDWSPAPGDTRKLPYRLDGGDTFRITGVRSALAKQMPALLKEKNERLADSKETR